MDFHAHGRQGLKRYYKAAEGVKVLQVSLRRLGGGLPLQKKGIDEGIDLAAQDLLHVAGLQAGPMVLHKLVGGKQREPPVCCSAG